MNSRLSFSASFLILLGCLFVGTGTIQAQDMPQRANEEARPSPNATVSQTIGTTVVTVSYGRPGVKGREVFGGLEPYGDVWRAGANEATVFFFSSDVRVDGELLDAGAYSFFAVPGEEEWTLIFNRQAEQWGAYEYDAEEDVARISATPMEAPHKEWLTYEFDQLTDTSARCMLRWSDVAVPFTINLQ